MHIVVQDFSGHPFQVQLSRELASRGHVVQHWYCSAFPSGKGAVAARPGDPPGLSIVDIALGGSFDRYHPVKRLAQEAAYGRALSRRLARVRPDVVLLCNTPLVCLAILARSCTRLRTPMVLWQQDLYAAAIAAAAKARLGPFARPMVAIANSVEGGIARRARAIIAISEDFLPVLEKWRVADRSIVIPNWAPVDELPSRPADNEWARLHGLCGRPVVLYSGTLGLKHNPALLASLALQMRAVVPDGRLVVISEGLGRRWLLEERRRQSLDNLILLDYQPYERLPEVMAAASVHIAILEPNASRYSVPSKVLSYLCSGRPIVGVIPLGNAAATTLQLSGAGIVVDPNDEQTAAATVIKLLLDEGLRARMGAAGRGFAELNFRIGPITDQFEATLRGHALQGSRSRSGRAPFSP